nr:ATP-binding cassette domain-containing protein [Angustibacter aerolatus]
MTDDRTAGFLDQPEEAERHRHRGRLPADRRLHPGEGQERHRDAAALAPRRHRDLRGERRDGAGRAGRARRRRQVRHRQGAHRLDRRHQGRRAGHRRRQLRRGHRVEPGVRPVGAGRARGVRERRRRTRGHHHDRQPVRQEQRGPGHRRRHRVLSTPGHQHMTSSTSPPTLSVVGASKRFAGVDALTDVSLDLHPGSVHALVGENGAGKSTLIKAMTGVHQARRGHRAAAGRGGRVLLAPGRAAGRHRDDLPGGAPRAAGSAWRATSSSVARLTRFGALDLRRMHDRARTEPAALRHRRRRPASAGRAWGSACSRWSPSPAPSRRRRAW